MISSPHKILIIRFSAIGDIVLTTPVIRCLRKTYPDIEIHYLTKKANGIILENNPYIDKLHLYEDSLSATIKELKKEKINYIIDLHHNLRTWVVKKSLGVKSYSFRKLNYEKWLLVNFKINILPKVHIVDRYMETLKSFNVKNDNAGLDYFISEQDEIDTSKLPVPFSEGYIALVLSGTFYTKRFPVHKIIQLCQKLDKPVILIGGPTESDNAELIIEATGTQRVFNAVNKYNIGQSASLLKQAAVVITNDTGMMHIAAAFKKQIISIWGNTIPEFGMSPYFAGKTLEAKKSDIIEVQGLSCRPCSKLGFNQCPKGHFKCMNEIDLGLIIQKVNEE